MSFSSWRSYIAPQLIARIDSPVNGIIHVEEYWGGKRVMVGKYIQSGEYAKKVLNYGIKGLAINPSKILVLGVGGGTMIGEMLKRWPSSSVTAVDIDPVMIDIAKNYFGLSSKRITFVVSDAVVFVKKNKETFDLIIDDLFVGCDRPKEADNTSYAKNIVKLLDKGGVYICNRSYLPRYKKRSDEFIARLERIFTRVEKVLKYPNMLVRAYT